MLATAADIVADPSAPDAFVEGIMEVKSGYGMVAFFVRSMQKNLKEINTLVTQKQLDEKKLSLFNDFLANL